jgi:hypothetical protein
MNYLELRHVLTNGNLTGKAGRVIRVNPLEDGFEIGPANAGGTLVTLEDVVGATANNQFMAFDQASGKYVFKNLLASDIPALNYAATNHNHNGVYALVSHTHSYSSLTGIPTTFTPAPHSHTVSDVSGLQGILDGKQPAGSYAAASHTHSYNELTDRPTLFNGAYASLTGIPSTFTPSAHSHTISEVTGLQSALDGKQPTGSYLTQTTGDARYSQLGHTHAYSSLTGIPSSFAPSAHTHAISEVTGLQTALDGKQPTGAYLTQTTGDARYSQLGHTHAYSSLTGIPTSFTPSAHTHATSEITGLDTALNGKQATLVSGTNIKTINGESLLGSGNIVITSSSGGTTLPNGTNTNQYVGWNGSSWVNRQVAYTEISGTPTIPTNTSQISESGNLYFTTARVLATTLAGYTLGANTALLAGDTILQAMGKIQAQLDGKQASGAYLTQNQTITLSGEASGSGTTAITVTLNTTAVTGKALTNYTLGTNTALAAADSILAAFGKVQAQLNAKQAAGSYEGAIAAGTTSQYWRGDKTWQTLDKSAVGLSNVANLDTSTTNNITDITTKRFVTDAEKATWNAKENAIAAGNATQYWRGDKTFQTLDKAAVGLGNVANLDTSTTTNITDTAAKRFASDAEKTNWNTGFNKRITGIAFTGASTKTLTLTAGDGTTISNTFTDNTGTGGGADTEIEAFSCASVFPYGGSPGTQTHNTIGTANCSVFPIDFAGTITVSVIQMRSNLASTNSCEIGIFDSTGVRVYHTGTLSTVASGWLTHNVPVPFVLTGGRYYIGFTNKITGTAASYMVAPAIGGLVKQWGTVPNVSAGNMPTSFNPASISESTGSIFPIFIRLSS